MRVLIVSEDIPNPHLGGLGKHALNLAHALAARGHVVDLLGSAKHAIADLPEQRGPGRFFGELAGYERGWKQQRLGAFHAWAARANARPLREAILRHAGGYDVVHYHGHLPWVAASLPAGMPFVQTRHDQGGDCMLKTRFIEGDGPRAGICARRDPRDCAACATPAPNLLQRALSSHAVRDMRAATTAGYRRHATVFVSEFLQQNFERTVGGGVPGCVVPNAVDTDQLHGSLAGVPLHAADGAAMGPQLFAAGAMFAYKGFGPLLEALATASRRHAQPFQLRLAGAGPLLEPLKALHASPQVQFLGWCAYPDVLRQTLAADAVLVPSLWDEPCATSVLEALALGKSVYALRKGGTPEMLAYADSAGGQLLLFDDLAAMADAALQHPIHAPQPSQPGRFLNSVRHMAERIEQLYETVMARSRRPGSADPSRA